MRSILLSAVTFLLTLSCNREEGCFNAPVDRLFEFRLVDGNNVDLLDSTNSLYVGAIYTRNPCTGQEFGTTIYRDSSFFYSIAKGIAYEGVQVELICKKFLLLFENGEFDTITYELIQNKVEGCPIRTMKNVKFNGKEAELTVTNQRTFYTFRK